MPGTVHTPLNDITALRSLLNEQYGQEALLKELLQNADDAGASRLYVALVPGDPDDSHPLRQGPGLLVVNDGKFDPGDDEGIRSLGGGTKSADAAVIGKFGLGLKTVFHFCEAFYYFAGGSAREAFGNLYNPWSHRPAVDHGLHDNWEESRDALARQANAMLARLERLWPGAFSEKFFALLLPLRSPNHKLSDDGSTLFGITETFPQITEIAADIQSDKGRGLAGLLPLLRHVREVVICDATATVATPVANAGPSRLLLRLDVTRKERARGHLAEDWAGDPNARRVSGSVALNAGEAEGTPPLTLRYVGFESRRDDVPELNRMPDQPGWPNRTVTDAKTAKQSPEPEKGEPHGAVLLYSLPHGGRGGCLHATDAVFLPLGQPLCDPQPLGNMSDVHLILHGYSFLDSGRKRRVTDKAGTDEVKIEGRWNRLLREMATLPQALPALAEAVRDWGLSDEETRLITRALGQTPPFASGEPGLYIEHQWLATLTAQGVHYGLQPSSRSVRLLPAPPTDKADLPFQVFPGLKAICDASGSGAIPFHVTYGTLPRLCPAVPEPWEDRLDWMASMDGAKVLGDQEKRSYLFRFLRQERDSRTPEEWKHWSAWALLLPKLARGLAGIAAGLTGLRKEQREVTWALVRPLVALLPGEYWVTLPLDECLDTLERVAALVEEGKTRLVVPRAAVPPEQAEEAEDATLSETEAAALMFVLADQMAALHRAGRMSNFNMPSRATLAARVVERTRSGNRRAALGEAAAFFAHDAALKARIPVSWNDLLRAHDQARLFITQSTESSQENVELLQRVLLSGASHSPAGHVLTLTGGAMTAVLFESRDRPREFGAAGVAALLSRRPPLATPLARVGLLEYLLRQSKQLDSADRESDLIAGIRYLLHGRAERFDDTGSLLFAPERDQAGPVCETLARHLAADAQDEWQLIDARLAGKVNDDLFPVLGVQRSGIRRIEQRLLDRMRDSLSLRELPYGNETDCHALLTQVSDPDLWCALPLHQTVSGDRVAATDIGVFYTGSGVSYPIPDSLHGRIHLIARPEDAELERRCERWLAEWNAEALLIFAAREQEPSRHAAAMLDALTAQPLRESVRRALREAAWLPRTDDKPIEPQYVLYLPECEQELHRFLARPESAHFYSTVALLSREVREHPALPRVKSELFAIDHEALTAIAELLAEDTTCHLGSLQINSEDALRRLAENLCAAPREHFPAAALLQSLGSATSIGWPKVGDEVLPKALQAVSATVLRQRLQVLADKRETRFLWEKCLEALLQSDRLADADLRGLLLPSEAGEWISAERLCIDQPGIVESDRLARGIADLWRKSIPATRVLHDGMQPVAAEKVILTGEALENYFQPWAALEASELIGGFIAIMAHVPGNVRNLADHYLGGTAGTGNAERLREAVNVQPGTVGAGFMYNLNICQPDDERLLVPNLLGQAFGARIKRQGVSSLLVSATTTGGKLTAMFLRSLPHASDREEVSRLLLGTVADLANVGYLTINQDKLEERWLRLARPDSVALRVAQQLILDSAFFYFQQVGSVKNAPELKGLIQRFNNLKREEIENGVSLEMEKKRVRAGLGAAFGKESVRRTTLEAVKDKVRQYQYKSETIPFELFQNADDARVEWDEMTRSGDGEIVFSWGSDFLRCFHWGRPVNRFRRNGFPDHVGLDRGFDRDLEKMLILSSSDKGVHDAEAVTGKFGLGFKSVFLFSDEPAVVSGALGFYVRGGMYPEELTAENLTKLQRELWNRNPAERHGTVINLVRSDQAGTTAGPEVMARFALLAPVQIAFARRLRGCTLVEAGQERRLRWDGVPVGNSGHIEVGRLGAIGRGVLLKTGRDHEGVLFALSAGGVLSLEVALKTVVPTFWVTAPTQDETRTGFAVNAPFSLDPGRARLGDREENERVAGSVAAALGEAFVELFDEADAEWGATRKVLGLADSGTRQTFFTTLWECLRPSLVAAQGDGEGGAGLVARALGFHATTAGRGYARLIACRDALPTGLWGPYAALTRVERIDGCVTGLLDQEEVFKRVAGWPGFRQKWKPGRIVSEGQVGFVLDGDVREEVTLADVIRQEIRYAFLEADDRVSPDFAQRIGALGDLLKSEKAALNGVLQGIRFQSRIGTWRLAAELLIPTGDNQEGLRNKQDREDEVRRTKFAPEDNLLADAYCEDPASLVLFLACRNADGGQRYRQETGAKQLADWGRETQSVASRNAFKAYLDTGLLGNQVKIALGDVTGTWLQIDEAFQQARAASEALQGNLAVFLSEITAHAESRAEDRDDGADFLEALPPMDAASPEELERIYAEWMADEVANLRTYDADTYPDSGAFLEHLTEEPRSAQEREAWVTLLLRGSLEMVGLSGGGQRREFLRLCQEQGWIETFAARRAAATGAELASLFAPFEVWIAGMIDRDNIPHFHNLRFSLPTLFMMCWLDEYAGAFHRMNRAGNFHMQHFLVPFYAVADANAPPLKPYLGIGAHFVLRELVRKGVIHHSPVVAQATKFCYIPSRSVRELLGVAESGTRADQSVAIYDALCAALGQERATFGGAFDLPLIRHLKIKQGRISTASSYRQPTGWITLNDGRRVRLR